jgi:hypothetical protein
VLHFVSLEQTWNVDTLLYEAIGQEQSLLELKVSKLFVQAVKLLVLAAIHSLQRSNLLSE